MPYMISETQYNKVTLYAYVKTSYYTTYSLFNNTKTVDKNSVNY